MLTAFDMTGQAARHAVIDLLAATAEELNRRLMAPLMSGRRRADALALRMVASAFVAEALLVPALGRRDYLLTRDDDLLEETAIMVRAMCAPAIVVPWDDPVRVPDDRALASWCGIVSVMTDVLLERTNAFDVAVMADCGSERLIEPSRLKLL